MWAPIVLSLALIFGTLPTSGAAASPSQGQGRQFEIVTGILTDEGVECQALRGDDGTLYTLAGDTKRFTAGDRVTVTGTIAEVSTCQQGTTITVQKIQKAKKK